MALETPLRGVCGLRPAALACRRASVLGRSPVGVGWGGRPLWAVLVILLSCALSTAQQPGRMQFLLRSDLADAGESYLILPQPPRELRRAVSRAEQAIGDGRYAEAIEALDDILTRGDVEDFFLPEGAWDEEQPLALQLGQRKLSLKQYARDLLGNLPREGRETYQLLVGSDARRLLVQAVTKGDVEGIMEVSRRYFHTDVGYDATLLLARWELDRGHPLAASLHLRRLSEAPGAVARFEPELSLLWILSHHLAGEAKTAAQLIEARQAVLAGAEMMWAGQPRKLPVDADALQAWLSDWLPDDLAAPSQTGRDWRLVRGGPDRNAEVAGGMPLNKLEWSLEAALLPRDETLVRELEVALRDNETSALPVLQPLAVGDQLLMRTARVMLSVELQSGRRIWPYPEEALDWSTTPPTETRAALEGWQPVEPPEDQDRFELAQRMWQDALHAQMSSDGQRLFLLRDLAPADAGGSSSNVIMLGRGVAGGDEAQMPLPFNRLVALELATEGKTLWMLGGPDSQEPALQDAFFLGAPLPVAGRLYVVAELRDELKLLALDPATGRLEWAQQLAQVEAPFKVHFDAIRRLTGAVPSFAEGVLVCPTSSGAVVAVDLASRTLLWGATYGRDDGQLEDHAQQLAFNMPYGLLAMPPLGQHFADGMAIIHQGRVVLTPIESNQLHCLDLFSGEACWSPIPREEMMFAACAHEGVLLTVHSSRLRGIRLEDGQPAWPEIRLAPGELPSGRGFLAGGHYYLPTRHAELLRIDMSDGTLVERQPTERVLGNLICHGDLLISQGVDGVFAYSLRARKREAIGEILAANPRDPEALADYADLLASDGKLAEALRAARQALQYQTEPELQPGLAAAFVRIATRALETDFATHRDVVDEALRWADESTSRQRLLRAIARGREAAGEPRLAFEAYLELMTSAPSSSAAGGRGGLMAQQLHEQSDPDWRISDLLQLRLAVQRLMAQAEPEQAAAMGDELARRALVPGPSGEAWAGARWLELLSLLPDENRARLELAPQLAAHGETLAAEVVLTAASLSDSGRDVGESLVGLARLFEQQQAWSSAAAIYDRLAGEWQDAPLVDGATGDALRQAFQQRLDALGLPPESLRLAHAWPRGHVTLQATKEEVTELENRPWLEVELVSSVGGWPQDHGIAIDRQSSQIVVTDGYGQIVTRVPLDEDVRHAFRSAHARAFGRLLIVSLGTRVMAIDTRRPRQGEASPILWEFAVQQEMSSVMRGHPVAGPIQIRPEQRNSPFDHRKIIISGQDGSPLGQLGPVSCRGVCVIRNGDLHCLDLLTGTVRWVHRNIGAKVQLFGDQQHVYACRTVTGDTRIFSLEDGREVRETRVPQGSRHWDTVGRYVLYYEGIYSTGRDLEVRLFDAWEERDVWTYALAAKSKGCLVGRDELALMEPEGKFVILNLVDGRPVLETTLLPEEGLEPIYVYRSPEHYLVITDREDRARIVELRRAGIQVQLPATGMSPTPQITGHIYAFARDSAAPLWPHPVQVEQYGLLLPLHARLPALVLLRQVVQQNVPANDARATQAISLGIALIDLRDGSLLDQRDDMPLRTAYCTLLGDPRSNSLFLDLPPETRLVLQWTDAPQSEGAADPPAPVVLAAPVMPPP